MKFFKKDTNGFSTESLFSEIKNWEKYEKSTVSVALRNSHRSFQVANLVFTSAGNWIQFLKELAPKLWGSKVLGYQF